MMNSDNWPPVSIVVIGINEGKNLENTFRAIETMDYPAEKVEMIYVDTGSNDESVEIARRHTSNVFIENSSWPTSGLARNRGILASKNEIIHFIDGDISITKDYLKLAISKILQPGTDAVTGYFLEQYPEKFFNKLMSIRRDSIIHRERNCESTNGGGTYRREKLMRVNGYDERILKGQESELGYRYRNDGNKILFIDVVQGLHNFDINSTRDFLRAKFIYGKSNGYILKMKDRGNDYITNNQKSTIKVLIANTFSVALIAVLIVTGYFYLIPFYYAVRISILFYTNKIKRKKNNRELLYDLFQYLFLFATYAGILSILFNFRSKPGKKAVLNSQ